VAGSGDTGRDDASVGVGATAVAVGGALVGVFVGPVDGIFVGSSATGSGVLPQATIQTIAASAAATIHIQRIVLLFIMIS
jgi:hypothetical protein